MKLSNRFPKFFQNKTTDKNQVRDDSKSVSEIEASLKKITYTIFDTQQAYFPRPKGNLKSNFLYSAIATIVGTLAIAHLTRPWREEPKHNKIENGNCESVSRNPLRLAQNNNKSQSSKFASTIKDQRANDNGKNIRQ
ncbi:MAG: hypothetical protein ACK4OM_04525 [Alphaproteobacteria bacterium]